MYIIIYIYIDLLAERDTYMDVIWYQYAYIQEVPPPHLLPFNHIYYIWTLLLIETSTNDVVYIYLHIYIQMKHKIRQTQNIVQNIHAKSKKNSTYFK